MKLLVRNAAVRAGCVSAKTLKVKVPAGVDNDSRIRLSGEGEAGLRGGSPGDLYIFINVKPHKIFERRGNDVYMEMPITFTQAALGGEISVPTLEGKAHSENSRRACKVIPCCA